MVYRRVQCWTQYCFCYIPLILWSWFVVLICWLMPMLMICMCTVTWMLVLNGSCCNVSVIVRILLVNGCLPIEMSSMSKCRNVFQSNLIYQRRNWFGFTVVANTLALLGMTVCFLVIVGSEPFWIWIWFLISGFWIWILDFLENFLENFSRKRFFFFLFSFLFFFFFFFFFFFLFFSFFQKKIFWKIFWIFWKFWIFWIWFLNLNLNSGSESFGSERLMLQSFSDCADSVSQWMSSNRNVFQVEMSKCLPIKLNLSKTELIRFYSSRKHLNFIRDDSVLFGNRITPVVSVCPESFAALFTIFRRQRSGQKETEKLCIHASICG